MKYDLEKMNFVPSLLPALKKVRAGDTDNGALLWAFDWCATPEGAVYWSKQFDEGVTVTGLAALAEIIAQAEAAQ